MLPPFQARDTVTDAEASAAFGGLFGMAPSFHRAMEDDPVDLPQLLLVWMLCLVKLFCMEPL